MSLWGLIPGRPLSLRGRFNSCVFTGVNHGWGNTFIFGDSSPLWEHKLVLQGAQVVSVWLIPRLRWRSQASRCAEVQVSLKLCFFHSFIYSFIIQLLPSLCECNTEHNTTPSRHSPSVWFIVWRLLGCRRHRILWKRSVWWRQAIRPRVWPFRTGIRHHSASTASTGYHFYLWNSNKVFFKVAFGASCHGLESQTKKNLVRLRKLKHC